MKGTILDFLELAAEKPELAKELIELAARHRFEFTDADELDEDDLKVVAGGSDNMSDLTQEQSLNLQIAMERRQKTIQTLSNIMKQVSSTQDSIVDNIK